MQMKPTIDQIDTWTNDLAEYFKSLGLVVFTSQSRTNFGASNYLNIYASEEFDHHIKLRISDHSCGTARIVSERHYFRSMHQEIIDEIERYYFSSNFNAKEVVSGTSFRDVSPDQVEKIANNYDVVNIDNYVTKKGKTLARITFNTFKTVYVRKESN
jgi:hypothetical protein